VGLLRRINRPKLGPVDPIRKHASAGGKSAQNKTGVPTGPRSDIFSKGWLCKSWLSIGLALETDGSEKELLFLAAVFRGSI